MSRTCRRITLLALLLAIVPLLCGVAVAAPQPPGLSRALEVRANGPQSSFTLFYPEGWSAASGRYRDTTMLYAYPDHASEAQRKDAAKVTIRTEKRLDHADAVERLRSLAAARKGEFQYVTIGGWPALERTYEAPEARRGVKGKEIPPVRMILHASVAIAAGSDLIRIDADIPTRNRGVADLVKQIGRQIQLASPGDPAAADEKLRQLKARPLPERRPLAESDGSSLSRESKSGPAASRATPGLVSLAEVSPEAAAVSAGAAAGLTFNLGNFSEAETVVSTDGRNIVNGTNSRAYTTSTDGGQTFTSGTIDTGSDIGYDANGDPSLGYGQSGNFYYAFIAYPDGGGSAGGGDVVDACTTGVTVSTDGGLNFSHVGHAAYCARVDAGDSCFPDQEHIAVDRWNPSASGQDQLYNTWRDFDFADASNCDQLGSGNPDATLTCSTDGGATWNNGGPPAIVTAGGAPQGQAPVLVDSSGDFPRIAVGPDGFVYVVYMDGDNVELAKYTSCQAGLDIVGGFPITVASGVDAIPCGAGGLAGLDRCNDGNDLRSPTVAIDPLDASHVFVAIGDNQTSADDRVLVYDSTDGGETFSSAVRLNSGFATRRFMPWACSTCGEAFVGWYDRRASTFSDNSLTDYYVGRAKRTVDGFVAGTERRVTTTSDSHCGPANDPDMWPCAPRSPFDSENCAAQPQLAGRCFDTTEADPADWEEQGIQCDFSDCGAANTDIDFVANPNCQCGQGDGTDIQCMTGGGCPKFGDYNGIACEAGRVYSTYSSATPPGGPQDPGGDIDTFLQIQNVCAAQIQVPGDVDFIGGCDAGGTIEGTLNVCNTGKVDLEVDSIASDDTQFAVTTPSSGYPVVISPDFCFPFEVTFNADTANNGAQTATLTINSNDPVNPALAIEVSASADSSEPDIRTTLLNGLNFDDVCIGDIRTVDVTIQNSGGCPLNVTSITSSDANFQVGAVSAFPLVIPAGDTIQVPIEFQPVNGGTTGAKGGDLTIASNDPDTPSLVLAVTGNVPTADATAFIANSGSFGDVCADTLKDLELTIQNNGLCPLSVTGVALSGANPGDFSLPSTFSPVVLESLNSVVMPVRFQPTEFVTASPRTASVDVTNTTAYSSDAPVIDSTAVSGTVPPPDINVPANTGLDPEVEFGNVCAGAVAEKEIPVCNTGLCTLNVTSATLNDGAGGACDDFTIVQNPFPSEVSHDFCMSVVVRYTPTEEGEHTCTLTIESDDPDESPIDITLHGTTPTTIIDIPGDLYFSPEVVQTIDACNTLKPYPISNNGICPLTITDVSINPAGENSGDYGLDGLPSFPIILQTGHIAGEGDLDVVFAPNEPLDRDKLGILSVTYVSDSVTGTTTTVDSNLCGEATLTGARVLVTYGGSPVDVVERIQIQRINANRNRRPQLDTVSVLQNVPLQEYIPSGDPEYSACRGFRYHSEYGTVSNPLQLLPGVYQVNATIRVNGRRYTKSVGFSVNACDFNPTVVVTF